MAKKADFSLAAPKICPPNKQKWLFEGPEVRLEETLPA